MGVENNMPTAKEAGFPDSAEGFKVVTSKFRTQEQIVEHITQKMGVEIDGALIKNDVGICSGIGKNGEKIELSCMSHYTEGENWSGKINGIPIANGLEDKERINNELKKNIIMESKGNLWSIKNALKYFGINW